VIFGKSAALPRLAGLKTAAVAARRWPLVLHLYALAFIALYAQILWETAQAWFTNDSYSHGVFIFPIVAWLLWIQRDRIRQAAVRPSAWGLAPLGLGLLLQVAGYCLNVKFLAMISLIPALAGSLLLLRGRETWERMRFAIYYLAFAAPWPTVLLNPPSNWIKSVSTTGSVLIMRTLGYPILQMGNIIEIPGMAVEVADVCSGFKKLVALIAFAILYGYLFPISRAKRLILVLAAIPIAVLANVVRVAGLVAVAAAGGERALHIAHDWAEVFVLVIAFCFFMLLGKSLGCKTISLPS